MLQDTSRFICPEDRSSLQWPEATCMLCSRKYYFALVPQLYGGTQESAFHLYDFRPSTAEIERDREDLEGHQKIIEGLLSFEDRKLAQMGFRDLCASLGKGEFDNSKLLSRGLYFAYTLRNIIELVWYIFSRKPTKKATAADSIRSSFTGYSRSYEMISDFARPNWLGWYQGKLRYLPVMLHHYQNMLTLSGYLRKWDCKDILEFGCGTGVNLLLLKLACPDGNELSVSGFDYAISRILSTWSTMEHFGLECENVFLANGLSLPLEDGSFDLVFSHYVVEQMAGYEEAALDSMLRVARVGVVMFESALYRPTPNQRIYMKHSGYSRRLPEVVLRRSDIVVEEMRNDTQDCFFGAPNVFIALRKKDSL